MMYITRGDNPLTAPHGDDWRYGRTVTSCQVSACSSRCAFKPTTNSPRSGVVILAEPGIRICVRKVATVTMGGLDIDPRLFPRHKTLCCTYGK